MYPMYTGTFLPVCIRVLLVCYQYVTRRTRVAFSSRNQENTIQTSLR